MDNYFSCETCEQIPDQYIWTARSAGDMGYSTKLVNGYNFNAVRPTSFNPDLPEQKLQFPQLLYYCKQHRTAEHRSFFPTDTLESLGIAGDEFDEELAEHYKKDQEKKQKQQNKKRSLNQTTATTTVDADVGKPATRLTNSEPFDLAEKLQRLENSIQATQQEIHQAQLRQLQEVQIERVQAELELFKQETKQYNLEQAVSKQQQQQAEERTIIKRRRFTAQERCDRKLAISGTEKLAAPVENIEAAQRFSL